MTEYDGYYMQMKEDVERQEISCILYGEILKTIGNAVSDLNCNQLKVFFKELYEEIDKCIENPEYALFYSDRK